MPTYLKYKYIFFFISISGRIRSRIFFPAAPDPWKKMSDPHPWKNAGVLTKKTLPNKNDIPVYCLLP